MTNFGHAAPDGLKQTPLFKWHSDRGARMADFAGYQMPIQYSSIVTEHTATRKAAGLFDVSHMARLRLDGPRSGILLDHLLTRRVTDLEVGQVRYSLMCNASGGILDDVLVSYLESPSGQQYHLLVVNAGNHGKVVKWMQPHLADFPDVGFSDVTESTAMIALQGPRAIDVIQRLFPEKPGKMALLKYYRATVIPQMGKPTIVSRTGYTGEDGFELIVRSEDAARVWENALLAGRDFGIEPVGLGARDTLRLEAGMPLYGHELSEEVDPISAGLSFAVNFKDRSFIGDEALLIMKSQTPVLRRVGLKLAGRRAAREGAQVLDADGRSVGQVTSGTFSPTLQTPIAMAYMAAESSSPGSAVTVDIRGSKVEAQVVALPFYKAALP